MQAPKNPLNPVPDHLFDPWLGWSQLESDAKGKIAFKMETQTVKTASRLQRQWRTAATRLGLRVRIPFSLQLPNGTQLAADVLLEGYGAPRGMLIFSKYKTVKDHTDTVVSMGYGYSCMQQPSQQQMESLEPIQSALLDWGKVQSPK
jgi:hypothetical protein